MKMLRVWTKKYQQYAIFLAIALFVIALYRQTPLFFFQQDEWLGFGHRILLQGEGLGSFLTDAFSPTVGHYNPLRLLVLDFLFSAFGLNSKAYAILSVTLHLASTILVFYLARLITKSFLLAVTVSFLFGVMASGSQATTWTVADISTHGATILGTLSAICFFSFLETRNRNFFGGAICALVLSLLFKEITIGLFLLLPLAFFMFPKTLLKKEYRYPFLFLLTGGIYVALRGLMLLLPSSYRLESLVTQTQSAKQLALNLFVLPINSVAQSIVPVEFLLSVASGIASWLPAEITSERFTPQYDLFVQQIVLQVLSGTIFLIIIVLLFFLWWKHKKVNLTKVAIFAFLWIILNSFLVALSPERSGIMSIVESRNLYFVSVGTALLIVSLATTLFPKRFAPVILLLSFLLNVLFLSQETTILAKNGTLRRGILEQIQTDFPSLPGKVIFYTESDSSFYGIPQEERILPFQSGFGQTLLVWYSETEKFPKEFFQNKFLWNITDQGYKEVDDQEFAYFRDFGLLASAVKEKKLSPSSVISFQYSSRGGILVNNTEEVRGRLAGYLADKKEINPRFFIATPSINTKDTSFMFDRKRDTFWNSEVPYATPQTIDINLRDSRKIAQVRIDSYNNKDQNEVGYEISTSQDGKDWKTTFYAKPYPPGEDGYVDLFFEPQMVRFIRIQQIGFHQYARWVIHELQLYETTN